MSKTIIFLHGFPEGPFAWEKYVDFFSKDYRVLTPDLSILFSHDREKPLLMKNIVASICDLIDQPCVLVGHDIGGTIAMCVATAHPELVEKLMIINASHPILFQETLQQNPKQQTASKYVAFLRDARAEKLMNAHHYAYFWTQVMQEVTTQKIFSKALQQRYEHYWETPGVLTAQLAFYREWPLGMDLSQKNSFKITIPTLAIWGEQDRAMENTLLARLPDYVASLAVKRIPEGSHWVHHEFPRGILRILLDFMDNKI